MTEIMNNEISVLHIIINTISNQDAAGLFSRQVFREREYFCQKICTLKRLNRHNVTIMF